MEEVCLFIFIAFTIPKARWSYFLRWLAEAQPEESLRSFGKKDLDNNVVLSGRVAPLPRRCRTLLLMLLPWL